jgi:transposase
MNGKGTRYSTEFKIKAVELSKSRGNINTVASELNITYESLQRWRKAYDDGKFVEGSPKCSPEQEEIFQLKRLLRDVTEERDILKKVVGIFSEKKDR